MLAVLEWSSLQIGRKSCSSYLPRSLGRTCLFGVSYILPLPHCPLEYKLSMPNTTGSSAITGMSAISDTLDVTDIHSPSHSPPSAHITLTPHLPRSCSRAPRVDPACAPSFRNHIYRITSIAQSHPSPLRTGSTRPLRTDDPSMTTCRAPQCSTPLAD